MNILNTITIQKLALPNWRKAHNQSHKITNSKEILEQRVTGLKVRDGNVQNFLSKFFFRLYWE